ncbi:TetR/AcrR family transcriptional regulator [Planosporangium mesophilum]|uniref:TetR family transcriptional regulator n=1 Tax=Planosporangium mesophilum TaxID=689768 RepID=A0A8J3TFG0_9ACTN|nr:TetR/AcrR family transcriptional regulator [Planosporangium mesophilum]NJC85986.1 TetR/AcrR family transcriptional regulator [Planosporangium mesophilum]GII25913.1 TetR family transcriptional regulator [Planosporangium mesophilum]
MAEPDPPRAEQRRTWRSPDRRDEILRAAFALFAERGYRGTSLAAVADRAGLSQPGLLHHFPGKEALLAGVLQMYEKIDAGRLFTGPTATTATETSLDRLAEVIEYNASRPDAVRALAVLAAESVTSDHPARAFFVERYAEFRKGAARALEAEFKRRGQLTSEQAAALTIAVLDGLHLQWLLQPDEIDVPDLFTAFLSLLRQRPIDNN